VSLLFEPLDLRGVTLRNRIGVSPMCQYSAVDGVPNDWHLVHLASRAVGGAGLVIAEASGVEARGRISPGCTGIYNDEQLDAWARITRVITGHGAVPGIQLAHAGRKASTGRPTDANTYLDASEGGWQVVGPSPQPFEEGAHIPEELTAADIAELVQAFADAAERAVTAGFRFVEVHAAHGYLLHSFLSPLATSVRTDTAATSTVGSASCWRSSRRSARSCPTTCRCRSGCRPATGTPRAGPSTTR
jgi:2,4-dienoyl-CoA reductase-like NADH-dependent reductase (Old Yellow Enzyme family)